MRLGSGARSCGMFSLEVVVGVWCLGLYVRAKACQSTNEAVRTPSQNTARSPEMRTVLPRAK